jgi:NTE family protein
MKQLSQISRSIQVFFRELNTPQKNSSDARPRTLGIALGGGFARGMAHVGALKVLEEAGIPVSAVSGTSAGAIVGAAYCSGLPAGRLAEIAHRVRFRDLARWTMERGGFCTNDRLGVFLTRICLVKSFDELRIPLVVVATELASGKPALFRSGSLAEAVRASCAYPGIFTPVSINGVLHVDGMLSYEVPTTPLRQMGVDCVLGVHLRTHYSQSSPPGNFFDVIGQCFAIAQTRMSLQWAKDADLLINPNVDGFEYDAFERADELIAAGEASMREALPALREKLGMGDGKPAQAREAKLALPSAALHPST